MPDLIMGIVGLLLSVVGLGFGYTSWRAKELRKDEILTWSIECIDILQRTNLAIADAEGGRRADDFSASMTDLRIKSSVQVERGRLFFRNVDDPWGADKPPAYQGLRPVILDCLVANCQICEKAVSCDPADLKALERVSRHYTRTFVSLAQSEVGRSRQSKSRANEAGYDVDVDKDMKALAEQPAEGRAAGSGGPKLRG